MDHKLSLSKYNYKGTTFIKKKNKTIKGMVKIPLDASKGDHQSLVYMYLNGNMLCKLGRTPRTCKVVT